MRSDVVRRGVERAPHRSLLRALGCTEREIDQPFVGVINSFNEIIPGHILASMRRAARPLSVPPSVCVMASP
jgi:dihydroxyacid dehydratase/phosphogluconate dehydratase